MADTGFAELILTCEDRAEAEKIACALLDQKLIACAKLVPVDSRYWWKGKIVESEEIMLFMETVADNFDTIESEVAKLHNYETFALQQIPLERVSEKAQTWLEEVIERKG